jgi:hypothetical protein
MRVPVVAGWLLLIAALPPVVAWPAPARAHAVSSTADVQLAQSFADLELTVVIRRVAQVPGPLRIDLVAYRPATATTVAVAVRSATTGSTGSGTVSVPGPGTHGITLRVAEAGPYELALRVGDEQSTLPFRVLVPRADRWESRAFGAVCAGALLGLAALMARRSRPRLAAGLGSGAVAAATAGVTIALLSSQLAVPPPAGAPPSALGRPYVQAQWSVVPPAPVVGEQLQLRLRLTDGATGRPADDLVAHHAALAHAVVTSQDGGFFRHVHPIRVAPGQLAVRLRVDRPGGYLVYAEFEREGSGGQLATGEFAVDGTPQIESVARTPVTVVTTPAVPVAGRPTTIEVATGHTDLQPWLGMAGHLIVRDEAGGFLGHAHELTSMAAPDQNPPEPTDARYGPALRFTFTFPDPGRYLGWVQFSRDLAVHTVPVTIEVSEEAAT